MKKFDLSEIMKRAWVIVKKTKLSFSQALKFSWKCAKKAIQLKESWPYELADDESVTFNIWSNYGKVRAYYKCSWYSKYANSKRINFIEY